MNTNCLKGVMCPMCGNTDKFHLSAQCEVTVTDEGTHDEREISWDGDNICTCDKCRHHDAFGEFSHPGFYVTFDVVTEESAEHGEAERRGWWEPGGWEFDDKPETPAYSFDPDDFDEEEHDEFGSAIVEWAVKLLRDEGATHFSGSDWFSDEGEQDIHDGSRLTRSFHFDGFSDELKEQVIKEMTS